ncbi:hypothetical protein PMIN06_010596 [Paraphaeosphaeria minitans]
MNRQCAPSLETAEQRNATPNPTVDYILKCLKIDGQEADGSDQETASEPGSSPVQPQAMLDPFYSTLGVEEPSFGIMSDEVSAYQTSSFPTGDQAVGFEPSIDMPALSADSVHYDLPVETHLPAIPDVGYRQHSTLNAPGFQLDYPLGAGPVDPANLLGADLIDPANPLGADLFDPAIRDECWVNIMSSDESCTVMMRNYLGDSH